MTTFDSCKLCLKLFETYNYLRGILIGTMLHFLQTLLGLKPVEILSIARSLKMVSIFWDFVIEIFTME